jgi:hypothetical protein
MKQPTQKAIQKETERLFNKHVDEIEKQYPGKDYEDITQYRMSDFEKQAIKNLIPKQKPQKKQENLEKF